jgi:hypothetical protein
MGKEGNDKSTAERIAKVTKLRADMRAAGTLPKGYNNKVKQNGKPDKQSYLAVASPGDDTTNQKVTINPHSADMGPYLPTYVPTYPINHQANLAHLQHSGMSSYAPQPQGYTNYNSSYYGPAPSDGHGANNQASNVQHHHGSQQGVQQGTAMAPYQQSSSNGVYPTSFTGVTRVIAAYDAMTLGKLPPNSIILDSGTEQHVVSSAMVRYLGLTPTSAKPMFIQFGTGNRCLSTHVVSYGIMHNARVVPAAHSNTNLLCTSQLTSEGYIVVSVDNTTGVYLKGQNGNDAPGKCVLMCHKYGGLYAANVHSLLNDVVHDVYMDRTIKHFVTK